MTSDARTDTLAQIVARSLEQSLKDGVYDCGERLIELTIAQEMSVSQNTVRDALRILEQDGWVVKRPRYGVTVRTFTAEEVQELYTLRATLEKLVVSWLISELRTEDHMHLANLISTARMQAAANNGRGIREALFQFHATMVEMTQRQQTIELLRTLRNRIRLLENVRAVHAPYKEEQYAEILTRYGELLTHLRYHQCEAAQNTIYNLILEDCRTLLPILDLVL